MTTSPPRWLETLVRTLVPPACREHIVGDFSERYRSPRQYVVDALSTLPFVITSQVRRTSDAPRLTMYVLMVFVLFGGLGGRPDAVDSLAWLRAAIPTIAVTLVLVLRDAYRGLNARSWRHAAIDAAVAVTCALLSQVVLRVAGPPLVLASRAAVLGSAGTFLMVWLRSAMPPENELGPPLAAQGIISKDHLARDVLQFEERIRRRNRREVIAGLVIVVVFGAFLWRAPDLVTRSGCALIMAGALFIIHHIRTRGVTNAVATDAALPTVMSAYRGELARQRDLLQTVKWWYLLPMFPGMFVLMLGQVLARSQPVLALRTFGVFLLVGVITRQLNQRGARRLQRKIDGLTAAGRSQQ